MTDRSRTGKTKQRSGAFALRRCKSVANTSPDSDGVHSLESLDILSEPDIPRVHTLTRRYYLTRIVGQIEKVNNGK